MASSFSPKNIVLITLVGLMTVLLMAAGLVGAVAFKALQPVDPQSDVTVQFVIPKGQSVARITERLQEEGLIKYSLALRYLIWRNDLSSKIQAGTFELSPAETPEEIMRKLTTGTNDIWVTIPEGKRMEEVVEYFSDFSEFDKEEFLELAQGDEGYLFPDTYLFPALADAKTVHTQLRSTFDKVVKENQLDAKAKKSGATLEKAVIMASILEREARTLEDMKIVAGILYNRLQSGMPLQVDATMQYAKGVNAKTGQWWDQPLAADKEIDSPYNTYKVNGLPPGPISNPGLNALKAAVEPTASDYVFYITDNNGRMHYAETYDEHLKNVNLYLR
jgi:UPF0755 protein